MNDREWVRGFCRTNLDAFERVEWPTRFYRVPEIGEWVEGRRAGDRPTLKVVGVTHGLDRDGNPYVQIELHR